MIPAGPTHDTSISRYLDPTHAKPERYRLIKKILERKKTSDELSSGVRDRYNFQKLDDFLQPVHEPPKSEWALMSLEKRVLLMADLSDTFGVNAEIKEVTQEKDARKSKLNPSNINKDETDDTETLSPYPIARKKLSKAAEANIEQLIKSTQTIQMAKKRPIYNLNVLFGENKLNLQKLFKRTGMPTFAQPTNGNNKYERFACKRNSKNLAVSLSSERQTEESESTLVNETSVDISDTVLKTRSWRTAEPPPAPRKKRSRNSHEVELEEVSPYQESESNRGEYERHTISDGVNSDGNVTPPRPSTYQRSSYVSLPPRMQALRVFFNERKNSAEAWKMKVLGTEVASKGWSEADRKWAQDKLRVWSCNSGSQLNARSHSCVLKRRNNFFDKHAIFVRGSGAELESSQLSSSDEVRQTSAYLPYTGLLRKESDHSISLKHKEYHEERHGSSLDPIITSDKITPEAQEILLVLRDTVALVVDDIVAVDAEISNRNFGPCISIVEHLLMIPNMMIALIDHLHYTPQEFELVSVAKNITNLIEEVSNDPVIVIFRMVELGHYLYYLGKILGEKIVPKDLPRLLHSIQVKIQRLKVGRVVRQYFHIPVSYDFIITPYNKDRQLIRLEEECRCLVNLLHPDDPRSQYCPPGYRTIEVLYDEDEGKFETFLHRLNRILSPQRCTARLVTTILRQFNGQELAMTAEHALDLLNSDHRPRYEDIRALVVSGSRPNREKSLSNP